jgi:predicted O-linked N-acetylglucosamine transferase (SPINDLY family)
MDRDDLAQALARSLDAQARGDLDEARSALQTVLRRDPGHAAALYSMAALDANAGHLEAALVRLDAALARRPDFAQALVARAQVRARRGEATLALADAQAALALDGQLSAARALCAALGALQPSPGATAQPSEPAAQTWPPALLQAMAQAQAHQAQGRTEAAVAAYGSYAAMANATHRHVALYNAAVALSQARRGLEAEAFFRQCTVLAPDFSNGHLSLGLTIESNGRPQEALAVWQACLDTLEDTQTQPDPRVPLLNHIGRLSEMQRDYPRATEALSRSLALMPDQPAVLHHWIHLRQKQCLWPVIPGGPAQRARALAAASALAMLGLSDDPAEQLRSAQRYVAEKVSRFPRAVPRGHRYGHQRLRIGYLSSDLSTHAVSLLTVELFEQHRRDLVEVHAFCWSREDGTAFRERVRRAFDHFHRIDQLDDAQAAQLIQQHEIDVLVDLQGLTSHARPNIVARGPAPLQVAFLGFPGPTALPHMDHVVADPFIFPDALRSGFTEAPLMLPTLYQCSDSQRPIGPTPTRAQLGLPEDAFVYCAFNNNFKFTPEVFESWMRILRQVPDAVLWLLEDNRWARANLQAAARAHGVDDARLLFAPRVLPQDYLARFRAADLFLDTCPYNAGTTANDALWAGLPLLTLSGRTYVSRMAGSLLTSAGLPELVTTSHPAYEQRAIALAHDRTELTRLRQHLADVKARGELFSTQRFVREFEQALVDALSA